MSNIQLHNYSMMLRRSYFNSPDIYVGENETAHSSGFSPNAQHFG